MNDLQNAPRIVRADEMKTLDLLHLAPGRTVEIMTTSRSIYRITITDRVAEHTPEVTISGVRVETNSKLKDAFNLPPENIRVGRYVRQGQIFLLGGNRHTSPVLGFRLIP